jgi:nitroimidazol reductase NimA-like FMN-containing flavoprotein (pyridoxamine 5'-phosphate oxidase superfamily)
MKPTEGAPHIRELNEAEIEAILARNHIGRIGFSRENRMEIQPVSYVYSEGWIYGRTSFGAKYEALGETAYQWWPVVFEVDEVEALFSWRSVIVRGGFYVISPESSGSEREAWDRALVLLRTLIPETFRSGDPVPHRTVVFRIAAQEMSGREATPPATG